jgi:hypothetical protein
MVHPHQEALPPLRSALPKSGLALSTKRQVTISLLSWEASGKKANLTTGMPYLMLLHPLVNHNLVPLLPAGLQPCVGAGAGPFF